MSARGWARGSHSLVLMLALSPGCAGRGEPRPVPVAATCPGVSGKVLQREYRESLDVSACAALANPERGFFAFRDLLAPADLEGLRAQGVTLVYGKALLAEYRERSLDAPLLARVRAGFAAIRRAGLKVLPRFYYAADDQSPDGAPDRALEHIASLAPLLRENADVIAAMHAGFVGAWGEWHPEDRASMRQRRQIVEALLSALPPERTVLLRKPLYKQSLFGGPLTGNAAAARARIGHLNDCFLASANDRGTYGSAADEAYARQDSSQVPVGGETCAPNPPRTGCASALQALERHHWSFLNRDYHPEVLASWRAEGCWPTIACRLGYHFRLRAVKSPSAVRSGQPLSVDLEMHNDGYARAINPRPVHLALTPASAPGGDKQPDFIALPTGYDVRQWAPGASTSSCLQVALPADLRPGAYRMGLALPDPAPTLAADPRFAVRLDGGARFDPITGVNWLDQVISVE